MQRCFGIPCNCTVLRGSHSLNRCMLCCENRNAADCDRDDCPSTFGKTRRDLPQTDRPTPKRRERLQFTAYQHEGGRGREGTEGRTLSLDTRDLRGGDARSHSSSLAQLVLNDRRKGTLFCAALPGQQTDIIKSRSCQGSQVEDR